MLDPLRFQRVGAQSPPFVFLVILEVALEPFDMGFAFEGEDVGAEAVEEEAVVADDDGAAGKRPRWRLRGRAGFRRPGRWWVRRGRGRCRPISGASPCGRGCARRPRAGPTFFC